MKQPNNSNKRRRIRDIEREAAIRTLNGNGASPSLPPLPTTEESDEYDNNNDDTDNDQKDSGLSTLFSHPYGALPYGNIYTAPSPPSAHCGTTNSSNNNHHMDWVRHKGLGPLMRHLNDEQLLSILAFVDGRSLSCVVQCSRYLYAAGHHDELWRDLTLRSLGDVGFDFQESWRDTFVYNHSTNTTPQQQPPPASKQSPPPPSSSHHTPIPMDGIYSDTFFRSWLCRSFTLQPSFLTSTNNPVPTEHTSTLTTERFLIEYENANIPVVIKDATKDWPAVTKWSTEYLVDVSRGVEFRATSGAAPLPATFTMERYARYCGEGVGRTSNGVGGGGGNRTEEAPLYLFDRNFRTNCPQLVEDYRDALRESCPYFDVGAEHGHDLFSLLGEEKRPDYCWIIAGPKRSGSSFHIDPNGTHAWNAPILGRKRWIFYPPGIPPPGVVPSPNGDDVAMPISLGEWFLTYWNDHVRQRSNPNKAERPMECTVEPGDILFVPHGWWHCVLNLDDGMSVGLTQNYVSGSNLPTVLRFLEKRRSQISGCRDRSGGEDGGAIQPDCLLEELTKSLKDVKPELLETAQGLAKKWRCAAWNDDEDTDQDRNEAGGIDGIVIEGQGGGDCSKKKKQKLNGRSVLDRAKLAAPKGEQSTETTSPSSSAGFTFSFM